MGSPTYSTRAESFPPIEPLTETRIARLITLICAASHPPVGAGRIALALGLGALCYMLFAAGVLQMIVAMFFGLSESLGTVPWPMAGLAIAALILHFPLAHSLFSDRPRRTLAGPADPRTHGRTLATTTYAVNASAPLLALFALWTPSGIVWWRADGTAFWAVRMAYGAIWLAAMKSIFDAGT